MLRELKVGTKIQHANLVQYFGIVAVDQTMCLVMELLPDGNLRDMLRQVLKPRPPPPFPSLPPSLLPLPMRVMRQETLIKCAPALLLPRLLCWDGLRYMLAKTMSMTPMLLWWEHLCS